MSRWILALALASVLALAAGSTAGLAGPQPVSITVDADPAEPGVQADRTVLVTRSFSVDILVGSISNLQAFNFELVYDQTVLSAPTLSSGSDLDRNPDAEQAFLSSTGRTWSCSPPAPSGDTDPDPNVGVAFLSCFSTGAPAGPDAVGEVVVASVAFDAPAYGTSSLTLRNVNTFSAGGTETGSCNPVVIVAADCTNASITVSGPVGGIAELPEVDTAGLENRGPFGPTDARLAGVVGVAAIVVASTGAWYARRRWAG